MRVFLDVNTFMDFVMGREPFYSDAWQIMTLAMHNDIICGVNPNNFPFAFHHHRKDFKEVTAATLKHRLAMLRRFLHCQNLNGQVIDKALTLEKPEDLEDGIIIRLAIDFGADVLLTRDRQLLRNKLIKTMTPSAFLRAWEPR